MDKISNLFNNKVPTKTEVKKAFRADKDYTFKLLIALRNAAEDLSESNYLKDKTINHLFEYLKENIQIKKLTDIEKIVYHLLKINNILNEKANSKYKSIEMEKSINRLRNNLNILLLEISNTMDLDCEDMIKKTLFNRIMYDLFNKRKLKEVLATLSENVSILNHHNFEGKNFDELLYNEYQKVKEQGNKGLIDYYNTVIKYIVIIPELEIDKTKYYEIIKQNIFEESFGITKPNPLQAKLDGLDRAKKSNHYLLLDDFVFTLDCDDAKRFDDALSIEKVDNKFLLGIHVADVVALGYDEHVILEEQPFPTAVGYAAASLEQNEIRNALSLFIQFDSDGIIEDYRIINSKIKPRCNIRYSELDSILFNKSSNTNFDKLDSDGKKYFLSSIHELLELYTLVDNYHFTSTPNSSNLASLMISKFMMLYGCIVSSYFLDNDYPFIYLNGNDDENKFSMINKGYDSGFSDFYSYARATSPIIDKASLISQIMLKKAYFSKLSDRELGKYESLLAPYVKKLNRCSKI